MHSQRRDSKHQHCYSVSQPIGRNEFRCVDNNIISVQSTCALIVYELGLGLIMIGLYCAMHAITMVSKVGLYVDWEPSATTGIAAVRLVIRHHHHQQQQQQQREANLQCVLLADIVFILS